MSNAPAEKRRALLQRLADDLAVLAAPVESRRPHGECCWITYRDPSDRFDWAYDFCGFHDSHALYRQPAQHRCHHNHHQYEVLLA